MWSVAKRESVPLESISWSNGGEIPPRFESLLKPWIHQEKQGHQLSRFNSGKFLNNDNLSLQEIENTVYIKNNGDWTIDILIDDSLWNTVVHWVPLDFELWQEVVNFVYSHDELFRQDFEFKTYESKIKLENERRMLDIRDYITWKNKKVKEEDAAIMYHQLSPANQRRLEESIENITASKKELAKLKSKFDWNPWTTRSTRMLLESPAGIDKKPSVREDLKRWIPIPPVFLENQAIMIRLKQSWIVKDDRVIIEDPAVLKRFEKYTEILTFLYDTKRDSNQKIQDKKQVVDNYLYLINDWSDWIADKNLLALKYIEAIYNDLIREWYIIEKDNATWLYSIKNISWKANTAAITQYERVLKAPNTRSMIDVVILSSMIGSDFALNDKWIIWEKSTITHILSKYDIRPFPDATRVEKYQHLLLDKDYVLQQIDKKIAVFKWKDTQSYQELTFLKNYIWQWNDAGGYMQEEYNKELYGKLNQYRDFIKSKASIDAFGWKDPSEMDDKTIWDFIKDNQLPSILFWIIMWMMWYKKLAATALWVWIFWQTIGNAVDLAGEKAKWTLSWEDLELVRPEDLSNPIENVSYKTKYEELRKLNNSNKQNRVSSWTTLPFLQNDTELHNIFNTITTNEEVFQNIMIKWKTDEKVATELKAIPSLSSFSNSDLKSFIWLLKSWSVDGADESLLDYLTSWVDVLTKPYEAKTFTNVPAVNSNINTILENKWNNGGGNRNERKDVLKAQEILIKELSTVSKYISNVKAYSINIFNWVVWNWKLEPLASLDLNNIITNIKSNLHSIDQSLSSSIWIELDSYKTYMDLDMELAKYEGIIDGNYNEVRKGLYKFASIFSDTVAIPWQVDLGLFLDREIERIWNIERSVPNDKRSIEPFLSILSRADKVIHRLEEVKRQVESELEPTRRPWILTESKLRSELNNRNKIWDHLKHIRTQLAIVENVKSETIDINNEKWNLEKLEIAYGNLEIYSKVYLDPILVLAPELHSPLLFIKADLQTYNTIKTGLKDKFEQPVKEYYNKNNAEKTELWKITQSSGIDEDVRIISEVQDYLTRNWQIVDTRNRQILQSMNDINNNILSLLETRGAVAAEPDKSLIVKANEKYEGFKNWFSTESNKPDISLAWLSSQLDIKYNEVIGAVRNINISEIQSNVENAYRQMKDYLTNKNLDDHMNEISAKWKEVFWDAFLVDITDKTSLKDLETLLSTQKAIVDTKIDTVIANINPGDLNTPEEISERSQFLDTLKSNFPEKATKILIKQSKLFERYMKVQSVEKYTKLNTAIDSDITLLDNKLSRLDPSKQDERKSIIKFGAYRSFLQDYKGSMKNEKVETFNNRLDVLVRVQLDIEGLVRTDVNREEEENLPGVYKLIYEQII